MIHSQELVHAETMSPPPVAEMQAVPASRLARFAGRILGRQTVAGSISGGHEFDTSQAPEIEMPTYETEMTAWTEYVSQDLAQLAGKLETNNTAADHTWKLHQKLYSSQRVGREWQDYGDLAKRGIDKRYGTQTQLRDNEEKLTKTIRHRKNQLAYAKEHNNLLEYTDELDVSTYARYMGEPDQLGDSFNVPKTKNPTTDPDKAATVLNELPFVKKRDIEYVYNPQHPKIIIRGAINFPTERIIGVESFDSWAGRSYRTF